MTACRFRHHRGTGRGQPSPGRPAGRALRPGLRDGRRSRHAQGVARGRQPGAGPSPASATTPSPAPRARPAPGPAPHGQPIPRRGKPSPRAALRPRALGVKIKVERSDRGGHGPRAAGPVPRASRALQVDWATILSSTQVLEHGAHPACRGRPAGLGCSRNRSITRNR